MLKYSLLIFALLSSCSYDSRDRAPSKLANISIGDVDYDDFDTLRLTIQANEIDGESIFDQTVNKGSTIERKLEPGTYFFALEFSKENTVTVSTDFCSEEDQLKSLVEVFAGKNNVPVIACFESGEPLASVTINPILKKPGEEEDDESGFMAAEYYAQDCLGCHGASGEGTQTAGPLFGEECETCSNEAQLKKVILENMPLGRPEACGGECSEELAEYILENFKG